MELSIVIIVCKEDPTGTETTLRSIIGVGGEILLYDTSGGSFSATAAVQYGARYHKGSWEGFDQVRYNAALAAQYDWILMLHTGEVLDEKLKRSLQGFDRDDPKKVYKIRFRNLFRDRWLRHGEWGGYSIIRLACRTGFKVFDGKVNEKIFLQSGIVVKRLPGNILHSPISDQAGMEKKMMRDALCAAAKYHRQGRKAGVARLLVSPIAAFVKGYFIKLGLLDGREGYICAKLGAWYTFMKYDRLRQLNRLTRKQP